MRTHIVLMLLIAFTITSFGQQKIVFTESDELIKSKNQKAYAWICTGIGTLVLASSLLPKGNSDYAHDYATLREKRVTATTYIVGGAFLSTGFAFFKASVKTRKKATMATAFINLEKIKVPERHAIRDKSFPAMGLKLSL